MSDAALPTRPRRRRTDRITSMWLIAAIVVSAIGLLARSVLPEPLWTMVHVLTLGVLTNGILQWSWYFTRTLLRLPPDDRRSGRDATVRVIAFNVALVGLVAAMWTASTVGTITMATVIGVVIAWHGLALLRAARTKLASRFAVVIRFYVAAAAFLVVGCALAGFITVAMFSVDAPSWLLGARDDLTVAHAIVNVGGWIGLSISGTLVTLGPTMLRTRMDPLAVDRAVSALPWLAGGIAGAAVAACLGWMPGVGIGLLVFVAAGAAGIGLPLVRTGLAKSPSTYATWTMTAGLSWVCVGLVVVALHAFTTSSATTLRDENLPWLALVGAGGLGQVFVAALTYLLPVVIGGGPQAVRAGMAVLETGWPTRVAVRNTSLVLLAVGGEGVVRVAWWLLVLATFAVDVVLLARAGKRQARVRRAAMELRPPSAPPGATRLPLLNDGATHE